MQVYREIPSLFEDRGIAHGEETPDFFVDTMGIDDTVKYQGMKIFGLRNAARGISPDMELIVWYILRGTQAKVPETGLSQAMSEGKALYDDTIPDRHLRKQR